MRREAAVTIRWKFESGDLRGKLVGDAQRLLRFSVSEQLLGIAGEKLSKAPISCLSLGSAQMGAGHTPDVRSNLPDAITVCISGAESGTLQPWQYDPAMRAGNRRNCQTAFRKSGERRGLGFGKGLEPLGSPGLRQ